MRGWFPVLFCRGSAIQDILDVVTEVRNDLKCARHELLEQRKLIMATATELNTKVDGLNTALVNIRADIQTIKDGLPSEGGMTQTEVDALDVRLGETLGTAQALDTENP